MPARLKDRQRQIPNGFKFYQPETGWRSSRYPSFHSLASSILAHRRGNPALAAKHNWKMTQAEIEDELDEFNARICVAHGWMDYLAIAEEAPAPPKPMPQLQQDQNEIRAAAGRAKKIWSGVKTLNAWLDSNTPAVPAELSASRAAVCASCPKNGQGDFTKWFTKPAAGAIKLQLERISERSLTTPHDSALNVCEVCLCPLKLKVHTPLEYIRSHLSAEVVAELRQVPACWIPAELSPG